MDLKQLMQQGRLSPAAFEKLSKFADLIEEWNSKINLTGFRNRSDLEELLIGESVLALSVLDVAGKRVADFGSGAGIPGLVWAICVPSSAVTSIEVRQKKVAFQKHAARSLNVNVEIIAGEFPAAVAGRRFDVIASRAIRFNPRLWGAAIGVLAPGGQLVRFGQPDSIEEGWLKKPISTRSVVLVRAPNNVSHVPRETGI